MRFFDWLDERLGYRDVMARMWNRPLPHRPSFLRASGSCLFWLLILQCVTGLMLMASYSPSMGSAWASVLFIDQSAAGWFLRGLHHATSHAMIVVLLVHVLRVLISGEFRAPRELVWATGLLLIPLVIVWTVTGNPLSGGQKGMAQIEVEGNILGAVPVVGPMLQRWLIGGEEIGNLTLTHLYFLHVGLLPLAVGGLCAVHLHQVIRHNAAAGSGTEAPRGLPYWPHQSLRNMTVLALLVGGLSAWVLWHGAPLDAPADPGLPSTPRPEWYFRWIFELRRSFTGNSEFLVTVLLPGALLGFFLSLPLVDRALSKRLGWAFRGFTAIVGLAAFGWLTYTSFDRDLKDPDFQMAQRESQERADRAKLLARHKHVTSEGATALLRTDARTQGPLLFARHCAACHSHRDPDGRGIAAATPTAPNLYGFGSAAWVARILDPKQIPSDEVFGKTKFRNGDMVSTVKGLHDSAQEEGTQKLLAEQLAMVAMALSAESRTSHDTASGPAIQAGQALIVKLGCTDCHKFHDQGDLGAAPDLTGYASREWLREVIANPAAERFYADDRNDGMPGFAADTAHPDLNLLSPRELDLLVDWLRQEWFEPPPSEGASPTEAHSDLVRVDP